MWSSSFSDDNFSKPTTNLEMFLTLHTSSTIAPTLHYDHRIKRQWEERWLRQGCDIFSQNAEQELSD